MEQKLKHLEFVQNAIQRMESNSFFAKGWSITLTAALFVLFEKGADPKYGLVALIPVIGFWILDGFFLAQQRKFRNLYDIVRQKEERQIDFAMDCSSLNTGKNRWIISIFSRTLLVLYVPLIATILVGWQLLK